MNEDDRKRQTMHNQSVKELSSSMSMKHGSLCLSFASLGNCRGVKDF